MRLAPAVFALTSLATAASAQQVVFQDGFENGLANWTATGLWNLEAVTDPCGTHAAPFPEGTQAAWYGSLASACTFQTGFQANSGSLTLNNFVDLPDAPSIGLHFWTWSETEYCTQIPGIPAQYDVHALIITVQSGGTSSVPLCPPTNGFPLLPWHEQRVDLSSFRGQRVRVAFLFETGDELNNDGRGWFVDDVRILAEPGERVCPSSGFPSTCPCLSPYVPVAGGCRNSTQQSAVLYSAGSVSVASDTLQLRVDHMPPSASALLAQSSASTAPTAFGDGIRCFGGQLVRLGTIVASGGVASWPPAGSASISLRGGVPPTGGTRFYTVFYRDVVDYCTTATFNLTETQRVQWVP